MQDTASWGTLKVLSSTVLTARCSYPGHTSELAVNRRRAATATAALLLAGRKIDAQRAPVAKKKAENSLTNGLFGIQRLFRPCSLSIARDQTDETKAQERVF
eukprot:17458-Heterococcus_DN1.PRE.1